MSFFIMFYPDSCPVGYKELEGDEPEWGSYLGGKLNLNRQECAEACSEKVECLSFEHSNSKMLCNLNLVSKPRTAPYRDFAFCQKSGNSV